jgi:hypothetical protein
VKTKISLDWDYRVFIGGLKLFFFFFLLIFEFLGYRLLRISQLLWMFAIFRMGKQFRSAVSRACKLEQIEVDSILAEAHWDYDGNCNQLLNNLTTAFDAVNVVDCILGNCSIVKIDPVIKLQTTNVQAYDLVRMWD